jgi:hypothetical protein
MSRGHYSTLLYSLFTLTATASTINWRAATWLTTFYLLTTDVLGPSSAPWSTPKLGFVPATILFVSMGLLAGYSSVLLWKIFLRLDCPQSPIRTWRDTGDRLCGPWLGNLITFMQSTQMFLGVAIVLLGNAQSLSQIIKFKLCFVVILLLLTLLGTVIGCIRTFRRLSLFCNVLCLRHCSSLHHHHGSRLEQLSILQ